jgi:hypothetical protein
MRYHLIPAFLLLLAFVWSASPSAAQTIGYADAIDRLAKGCGADIVRNCRGINLANGQVLACLNRNASKISKRCAAIYDEAFRLIDARAAAQDAAVHICDADMRQYCPGVVVVDGNQLECGLRASRAVSPACNQAITDAGWR